MGAETPPVENHCSVPCLPVTPAPLTDSDPSHVPTLLNGPLSPPFDPHGLHGNYSSDNDDGSETDNEALQKEIKRLKEK